MEGTSIIVPVYNEEKNIKPLYSQIKNVVDSRHEIIFVNDGSTDNSLKVLKSIKDKNLRIVNSDNYGLSNALTLGFSNVKYDTVVTLDGDLQNDPKDILCLIREMNKGHDVVCGWRYNRKDALFVKKIPSRIYNKFASYLFGLDIHDFSCTLRAYRKKTVQGLKLKKGYHRHIPAILHMKGYKVGEIKVNHRERKHGKAKYNSPKRFSESVLNMLRIRFNI